MPDFQPDPSIFKALTGPAVVAQTPADWQQEAERTQAAVALRQERQARAQEAAQKQADEQMVRDLAVKHNGDPDKIQAELMQVNPVLGAKVGEDIGKWRQAQAVALKEQNANDRAQHEQDLALLEAAGDNPAAYAVARTRILKRDPDMATLLPEQPDPVATANALKSGQALKDIFARRDHSIDMAAKGEWNQSLSAALDDPEVDTPEEWNDVLKGQRALGAPPAIIAQFGAFIPDTAARLARVRQLGLTPDQRSDNERMAAAQQATEAHQAVLEGQGAARVAQGAARVQIARGTAQRLAQGGGGGNEPVVAVLGDDGKPIYVPRSQAAGRRPAGGAAGAGGATPTAKLNATLTMQNRFNTQTKAAQISATSVAQMRDSIKAVKAGSMAAGSQGVLVTFQKLLDPNSVVRESEYDRSSAGQAMMSRLQGQYDRIVSGGAGVPVAELEKFVSLAEAYNRNAQLSAQAVKKQFDAMADEFGLNSANITRDFEAAPETPTPETTKGGGAAKPGASTVTATPGDFSAYLNRRKKGGS